jgi:predicted amidophosphoribosyltransferase
MSTAGLRGINYAGHKGWTEIKCRVCALKLDLTLDVVYACSYCKDKYEAYFCPADAKRLHYKCPFCGRKLEPITPWLLQQERRYSPPRR